MRTLHLYITRQVLATLMMTVAVFTFVLLLGNVLKEIMALLVNGQATLGLVTYAIGLLIPYVLVFALPIGMLTATLLVFGRCSADQELTAAKASGLSLVSLVAPILVLSVLMSALCGWINLKIAPACRAAYKDLIARVDLEKAGDLITEGVFITDIPGYWLYVAKKRGRDLENIKMFELENGEPTRRVDAREGVLRIDSTNRVMQISLKDCWGFTRVEKSDRSGHSWQPFYMDEFSTTAIQFKDLRKKRRKVKLSQMTLEELVEELDRRELMLGQGAPEVYVTKPELKQLLQQRQKEEVDIVTPVKVQIHSQVSFSFACIGFAMIGIPLGIRAHRRETSVGIAIALILVALYYLFIIVGQSLNTRAEYFPHLIVWLPNFLFQAIGAVLLWRANKGL